MILIKNIWHKDAKTVLLVDRMYMGAKISDKLEENGIFDKVIPYNCKEAYLTDTAEPAKIIIDDYFTKLLADAGIEKSSIGWSYTGGDLVDLFGIYLENNDMPFTLVESFQNQIAANSRIHGAFNLKIMSEALHRVQKKSGIMDGSCKNCDVLLYPGSKNISTNSKTMPITFNYNLGYTLITKEEKKNILKSFDIDLHALTGDINLLLPNSMGFSSGASVYKGEDIYLLSQFMVDYYIKSDNKKLVIKPHPTDSGNKYHKYFPKAMILNKDYPVELINLIDDLRINNTLSGTTSAVQRIQNKVDNIIETRHSFFQLAPVMHHIYFIFELCNQLGYVMDYYQDLTNDVKFFDNYCNAVYEKKCAVHNLDKLSLSKGPKCIFANRLNQISLDLIIDSPTLIICFDIIGNEVAKGIFDENIFELKLTPTNKQSLLSASVETIWVLCNDLEWNKKINDINIYKSLKYTGAKIEAKHIGKTNTGD